MKRCEWVPPGNRLYERYHDEEWGVPVHDDRKLFEFLVLEGAQAGLTWESILKRRDGYRRAFLNYDLERILAMDHTEVKTLMDDPGIIRNRLKIASVITNARNFMKIQDEYRSFEAYVWELVGNQPIDHQIKTKGDYVAQTPESERLSRALIKRGFKFVGPTIMHAYMQACGLVQDHMTSCFRYRELTA